MSISRIPSQTGSSPHQAAASSASSSAIDEPEGENGGCQTGCAHAIHSSSSMGRGIGAAFSPGARNTSTKSAMAGTSLLASFRRVAKSSSWGWFRIACVWGFFWMEIRPQ
jgi:hypothetical protein